MADGERSAVGLSVGATNLAAVTEERAVTRKPVLTLYRQRPPEVGVPAENPALNEPVGECDRVDCQCARISRRDPADPW